MLAALDSLPYPDTLGKMQIRIGVHVGAIHGGIIGVKYPRYSLFGGTLRLVQGLQVGAGRGCGVVSGTAGVRGKAQLDSVTTMCRKTLTGTGWAWLSALGHVVSCGGMGSLHMRVGGAAVCCKALGTGKLVGRLLVACYLQREPAPTPLPQATALPNTIHVSEAVFNRVRAAGGEAFVPYTTCSVQVGGGTGGRAKRCGQTRVARTTQSCSHLPTASLTCRHCNNPRPSGG